MFINVSRVLHVCFEKRSISCCKGMSGKWHFFVYVNIIWQSVSECVFWQQLNCWHREHKSSKCASLLKRNVSKCVSNLKYVFRNMYRLKEMFWNKRSELLWMWISCNMWCYKYWTRPFEVCTHIIPVFLFSTHTLHFSIMSSFALRGQAKHPLPWSWYL